MNCSPFLLWGTLEHQLKKEELVDPVFVYTVLKSLYVDDLNSGSSNVTEGYELYEKTKSIMLKAGMNMRKWRTDSPELMKMIEENEAVVSSSEPLSITDDPTCDTNTAAVNSLIQSQTTGKILGTLWDSNEDTLTTDFDEMLCLTELLEIPYLMKRILLSSISKIFDPMGLASPAVVMMKAMFQRLCKSGLDWDDPVDSDTQKRWDCWLMGTAKAKTFTASRRVFETALSQAESIELHGFGDSSIQAYGSCVYVHADYEKKADVHVMSSKKRAAPLKPSTIPGKELLSTLSVARLITSVRSALENFIAINSVNCWLDSSIALHWVTNYENEHKPYIEIKAVLGMLRWW